MHTVLVACVASLKVEVGAFLKGQMGEGGAEGAEGGRGWLEESHKNVPPTLKVRTHLSREDLHCVTVLLLVSSQPLSSALLCRLTTDWTCLTAPQLVCSLASPAGSVAAAVELFLPLQSVIPLCFALSLFTSLGIHTLKHFNC